MKVICNFFTRMLCIHSDLIRTNGSRLYCECRKCGRETSGILTGDEGFCA